jgi:hypothetical protein
MPVSKLIMDVTGESTSHTVIRNGDFIYQSSFMGVEQVKATDFLSEYNVVYSLKPVSGRLDEADLVERLVNRFTALKGTLYDFPGFLYLSLRYSLASAFKLNIPKKNLWQISGMYICTEFVEDIIDIQSDSMITPYKLYLKLKESGKWIDC